MSEIIRIRLWLILVLIIFMSLSVGCGERAVEQVEEQYDKTIGESNRAAVDANLITIDGSVRIYLAATGGSPSIEGLLDSGYMNSWPAGPDGVTYELADLNGKTAAVAIRNSAGSWWTAAEEQVSAPVKW